MVIDLAYIIDFALLAIWWYYYWQYNRKHTPKQNSSTLFEILAMCHMISLPLDLLFDIVHAYDDWRRTDWFRFNDFFCFAPRTYLGMRHRFRLAGYQLPNTGHSRIAGGPTIRQKPFRTSKKNFRKKIQRIYNLHGYNSRYDSSNKYSRFWRIFLTLRNLHFSYRFIVVCRTIDLLNSKWIILRPTK